MKFILQIIPLLFILFYSFNIQFNAHAKSFQFGTSTFGGEQQNADWKQMLVKKSSNRPYNPRFMTFYMDRIYRVNCSLADECLTLMEWERHALMGKDNQNCMEENIVDQLWHQFTPILEQQSSNGNNILGLAISLRSLSINIYDINIKELPKNKIEIQQEGKTKMLLLLLSEPPTPNYPQIMGNAKLIGQIGHWMNATKGNETGIWTMQNCKNGEGKIGLEIVGNLGEEENKHGNGQILRLDMDSNDLACQSNDDGTCLLAISYFNDESSQILNEFSLILSIFPRQCLIVDFANRKLAFSQRKFPQVADELGEEKPSRNEEESNESRKENGTQKRREISNWLSFVFSII